ncbi:MAG: hypothetical protein KUG77_05010, partial [Nannocystaceae bacterium]|nr:hypothetical protein [Nannocystaceae bacterium]
GFFMEPKPDLENKKVAEVRNFSVEYPGNWKTELETDEANGVTFASLTVESDGNAIAIVQVYEPGLDLDPEEVYKTYTEGMVEVAKEEFGGVLDVAFHGEKDFSRDVLGVAWVGRTGIVDVKLMGEKVPNRIQTVQQVTEARTVIIVVQAPEDDWKTASPGFDAIFDGLKESGT